MPTKGELEAAISKALVQFEIDHMGRGPTEARAYVLDDLVLVRLKGVLTPAEKQLTRSADGVELIKKVRATLIENARAILFETIGKLTGANALSLHTDISTVTGERVIVFVLDRDVEKSLAKKKGSPGGIP